MSWSMFSLACRLTPWQNPGSTLPAAAPSPFRTSQAIPRLIQNWGYQRQASAPCGADRTGWHLSGHCRAFHSLCSGSAAGQGPLAMGHRAAAATMGTTPLLIRPFHGQQPCLPLRRRRLRCCRFLVLPRRQRIHAREPIPKLPLFHPSNSPDERTASCSLCLRFAN